ncbi:immunoglobulin-like domain-containing protein [Nocardioides gilvus]|uniref:immunoglobulin-like domain-containing protein n=1 Tax=Nocardioides gilvus TaxID=1735589 RepID=UPI0013A56009|nr:immunoglobulin-like domain-containing protein [Nocardioides gilvus]
MRIHPSLRSTAVAAVAGSVLGSSLLLPSLAQAAVIPATAVAQPMAAPFATAATADSAVTVPAADILDVDLRDGTAADHAQGLTPEVVGEPVYGTDAGRARSTISFNGANSALKYPFRADHAKLAGGFALECTFRYDAPSNPTSEKALCSAKEAGGFATVANSSGITFMAHIGGGYKRVTAPLTPGDWYHTLVTWDGSKLALYVDGELVSETDAPGAYKAPTSGADSLVLAGDTQPGDAVSFWAQATIQNSRIWSQSLSADQAAALADQANSTPETPTADVFDVDFADGTATDKAGGIDVQEFNTPKVIDYAPLNRKVGKFDGSSAFFYRWTDNEYAKIRETMSMECVFKYDADAYQADGEESAGNLCGGKEAGGFAMALYGNRISFNPHVGGSYRNTQYELKETDRWVHAVGTYDGSTVRLYIDGRLVAENAATGTVSHPSNANARMMVIGGDAAVNRPNFTAPATIASARIFSDVLGLQDVLALQREAFGVRTATDLVRVTDSTPAAGARITKATRFDITLANGQAAGRDVVYALDGEPVEIGQRIGAGLRSGNHVITMDGHDHFGNVIAERLEFSSANIPVAGGTETGQGEGEVRLSAVATNPSGDDVTTTFRTGRVAAATSGTQGTLKKLPSQLAFTGDDVEKIGEGLEVGDDVLVTSPAADRIPYQRFDVPTTATDSPEVIWTGTIDPTREVHLRVWNGTRWESLASTRGTATGSVSLSASVAPRFIVDGKIPVLVTGHDAFADDFDKEVADGFENPDDYDFSIAHLTDTQYLSEGAVEQETPQERAKWAEAYTSVTQWIADNAPKRKIAFAAHTGDVIENWHTAGAQDNVPYRATAKKEFEVASGAQKILDDAGVANSVLPGNHDNLYGTDTGVGALFNEYFGPERYEAVSAKPNTGWSTYNASYHPWKPGDNSNSYNLFSASGLDFVVVNLGFGVDAEEVAWANSILERYSDRNAIVQTHAHTTPSTNPDGRGGGLSYDGQQVRHQVAAKNPNVFLVLSGHEHGVNIEVVRDLGEDGNHVVELLADYQFYTVPSDELGLTEIGGYNPSSRLQFGSSFFRLLQFDVDRAEMSVDTYSAQLDNFGATEYDDRNRYNGKEDDFTLPVQFNTRTTSFATDALSVVEPTDEVIGTETVRSGWPASVVWKGLEAGETYAWYSTSADAVTGDEVGGEVDQMSIFTAQPAGTDTVAPEIAFEADSTVLLGSDFEVMAGVKATDNTDGDLTAEVQVLGSVDQDKIGTYALVYSVADANGNQATATRTVEVVAPPAPVNTARPAINGDPALGSILTLDVGTWTGDENAERTLQWFRNGVTIEGATDSSYTVVKADQGTTLTATVRTKVAGNDTVVARTGAFEVPAEVVARDTTKPVLTVPADASVARGASFDARAGVRATDDTDGNITADVQVLGTVNTAKVGTYTLVYSVTDAAGNRAAATRTVEVTAPPQTRPKAVKVKLTGKNNGSKADRLKAATSKAAKGAKVRLQRRNAKGKWVTVTTKRLSSRGVANFTVKDRNGRKLTSYRVLLVKTAAVKAATSSVKRVR